MPSTPWSLAGLILGMVLLANPATAKDGFVLSGNGLHAADGKLLISHSTRLRSSLLRRIFRGYRVVLRDEYDEASDYTQIYYDVYKGKKKVLQITQGENSSFYDITTSHRLVSGPLGLRVGDTFGKLRRTGRISCIGQVEETFTLLCSRGAEKRLQFIFRNPYHNRPGATPRHPQPSAKARIISIRLF